MGWPKSSFEFSVMSYGKTQMNFLAISTDFMVVPLMPSLIIKEKSVKTNRKIQAKSHTKEMTKWTMFKINAKKIQ